MKKILNILLLAACAATTLSCGDDDDIKIDEGWKALNEAKIEEIKADKEYTAVDDPSSSFSVYYKPIKTGTGERVLMTDKVKVFYKGTMVDGKVFDKCPGFDTPETDDDEAGEFPIMNAGSASYGVIEGWGIILQHMRVGDRWNVWIPWQLAYGIRGNYDPNTRKPLPPPGCSALNFEMEVIEIVERGQ